MDLRRKLLSQSTVIFAARIFGAALIFLAQAGIARFWGANILGEYLLIIAAVNLIAVAMPLGFETIGSYFAAEYRAKGEGQMLWGFIVRAYSHVVVLTAVLAVLGYPLAGLFGAPGEVMQAHWVPAIILAFASAMVLVNGALLVGLKRPFAGFFADTIFRPLVVVAALGLGYFALNPALAFAEMIWIVALGYLAISLVHFGFVIRAVLPISRVEPVRAEEPKRWWRFAMPWVVIALATDYFFDLDLLLLAGHLSREELAIFGVCTRVFSLVSFGVASVYAVTLPDMFESEAMRDRAGFLKKVGDANLVASVLSVVLFVLMLVGAPFALMLFGPAFLAGVAPLGVLCLALVVRSVFGPASLMLSIHDRPYASLPSIALGLATLVAANLLLVPNFGLMGAASSALLSITVWSAAQWYTALRIAGVDVSIRARLVKPRLLVEQPAE
ncbi:MAG TPA: lipopolysaccharide biosynthesis protein [Devosia sp.]|nr:lipopolysaccharide biosynthesis protein [Devosia sp.]